MPTPTTPEAKAQKIESYCTRALMAAHLHEGELVDAVLSELDEEFGVEGMMGAICGWAFFIETYHTPECLRKQPVYKMIERDENGQERLAVPEENQEWAAGRAMQLILALMEKGADRAIDLFEDAVNRERGPDVVCATLAATAILVGQKLEEEFLQWQQERASLN